MKKSKIFLMDRFQEGGPSPGQSKGNRQIHHSKKQRVVPPAAMIARSAGLLKT
jgi:hypothetical protein